MFHYGLWFQVEEESLTSDCACLTRLNTKSQETVLDKDISVVLTGWL